MKILKTLVPAAVVLITAPVLAADSSVEAAIGGAVGGGVGAYIGNEVGGNTGAVVGGAVGAATGAAIATDGNDRNRRYSPPPEVYRAPGYRYGPDPYDYSPGYYSPPPSYRYERSYGPRHPGTFCPPGQAKKGRC